MPFVEDRVSADSNLLDSLRDATRDSHEQLDAQFGAIDLTTRAGYIRFLAAHEAGLRPLHERVHTFAEEHLGIVAPDLPMMLHRDLAELGAGTAAAPPALAADLEPAAVTYVIAGSRLGIAALARQPYWAKGIGNASRYMEDQSGLALWRALVPWLRSQRPDAEAVQRHARSAIAAFGLFARALRDIHAARAA